MVPSTTAHSAALMPLNADNANKDGIITRLIWGKCMELEDKTEDRDSFMDHPAGDKVQVHKSTEEFLYNIMALTSVSNANQRQLWQCFIVPGTPFTAAPRLDKVMAAECSKNLKSADTSLSSLRIQALFLKVLGKPVFF